MAVTPSVADPTYPDGIVQRKPYLVEIVKLSGAGGSTTLTYTSKLNNPLFVTGPVSWSISGRTISLATIPADVVTAIEIYGHS